MMYELRLKEIRRKAYKRLKDGLGTEKNRVVRAILKEARILLAEVEKMQANYDYAYDFITEAEFALSDILWVNELNEVVIEAPAVNEVDFEIEIEDEIEIEIEDVKELYFEDEIEAPAEVEFAALVNCNDIQYNLFDIIDKKVTGGKKMEFNKNNPLKVFEAFAGVGAQRMALRNIGIPHEVVGIAEIDKYAIKSYEAIHGATMNYGDISKINPSGLPDFDLFTYSFPCQDLSLAGSQAGMGAGTRSGLLYECEKIIEAKLPKFLLLENVKNLVGKKFKPEFDKWAEYLQSLGYTNYWQVLNAKDYGVPQNRERVFLVSILNDGQGFEFPAPEVLEKRIRDVLEPEVPEKFYLNKPFKLVNKGNIQAEFTKINFEQTKRIHGIDGVFQTLGACDRGINNILVRARLEGINYSQVNQILDPAGICATVTTCEGGHREPKILENYKVRKLTPLECWRLMSFDDVDFYKAAGVCSNSQLYKQAGNSIVVKVLEKIFTNLFK